MGTANTSAVFQKSQVPANGRWRNVKLVNNFIYIMPLITMLASWLLLDEHLTPIAIAGGPGLEPPRDFAPPCGVCRQVLMEFCDPDRFLVLLCKGDKTWKEFTLAELLIVTGIVAILVAVSIPIMSGQVQKTKEVRAKAEARILCMALWMYLHDLDEQDIHPESWELMMDLGGSFRDLGENPLENYLDGEISEDVSIYSVYYSDTLESYEGILCEIGGIEVEALISGKTEIVNP